jgi:hypothetical protein
MDMKLWNRGEGLGSSSRTPGSDSFYDSIGADPEAWVVVQEKTTMRPARMFLGFAMAMLMGLFGYGVFATGMGMADESAFNAGQVTVAAGCQSSEVQTKLVVERVTGQSGFWATGVEVSQVDSAACNGAAMDVVGMGAGDTTLSAGSQDITSGSSSYQVDFNPPVDANSVESVAVVIAK